MCSCRENDFETLRYLGTMMESQQSTVPKDEEESEEQNGAITGMELLVNVMFCYFP